MRIKSLVAATYVNLVDLFSPLKGKLSSKGFYHWKEFFNEAEFDQLDKLRSSLSEGNDVDILIKFPILKKLFDFEELNALLRDYLGKSCQFDYADSHVCQIGKPASPHWHHDSVGHRIKIFICVNDQTETACTEVVPTTHRRKYWDYNMSKFTDDEVDSKNSKKLIGKKGDLLIFDTNVLHRGLYDNTERHIVQFEFSSRFKGLKRGGHFGCRKSAVPKELTNHQFIRSKKLVTDGSGACRYPTL
jgi:hypothetical protein